MLVVFVIHLGGKLIEKTFEMVMLGWANKLGGVLLYIVLYTITFSVFLFYADKLRIFEKITIRSSQTYPVVASFGPKVINVLAKSMPFLKDSFTQLEAFFGAVSNKIQQ